MSEKDPNDYDTEVSNWWLVIIAAYALAVIYFFA